MGLLRSLLPLTPGSVRVLSRLEFIAWSVGRGIECSDRNRTRRRVRQTRLKLIGTKDCIRNLIGLSCLTYVFACGSVSLTFSVSAFVSIYVSLCFSVPVCLSSSVLVWS